MTNNTRIIKAAADFLSDIARVSRMSKENCQVADNHAQELYSLLVRPEPLEWHKSPDFSKHVAQIKEHVVRLEEIVVTLAHQPVTAGLEKAARDVIAANAAMIEAMGADFEPDMFTHAVNALKAALKSESRK